MITDKVYILAGRHQIFKDLIRRLKLDPKDCVHFTHPHQAMGSKIKYVILTCLYDYYLTKEIEIRMVKGYKPALFPCSEHENVVI